MAADDFILNPVTVDRCTLLGELPERAATIDDGYARTYKRTFLVQTIDLLDAGMVARRCRGLPQIFDAYAGPGDGENDPGAQVTKLNPRVHEDNPYLWAVEVEYSSKPAHPDYQDLDPLKRKGRRRSRFDYFTRGMRFDVNGATIVNSAGDPYDAIEEEVPFQIIEITKNLAANDDEVFANYLNAVNSDPAFGKEAFELKVTNIEPADEEYEHGTRFWPTKLTMHCRKITTAEPTPWRVKLLDHGYRYFDAIAEQYFVFRDYNGQPAANGGLLNGDGDALPDGSPTVFNTFQKHREISFKNLETLFTP
jgi:hypothetical protein